MSNIGVRCINCENYSSQNDGHWCDSENRPMPLDKDDILLDAPCTYYKAKTMEAEHEPKTGHWIYHPDWEEDGGCPYECDNCGRCYDYPMNFCGFCGAKMEVGNETD